MKIKENTNQFKEPLYDLFLIDKMCRGNDEQISKMVKVFIAQTESSIQELALALIKKDVLKIKKMVHKMKPSFTYYGTSKLDRQVRSIEALLLEKFEIMELESKIVGLAELAITVTDKMKNDFKH